MTTEIKSMNFQQIEIIRLAQTHQTNTIKYTNKEAFNVASDIRMERILPPELKSRVSLSTVFGVDATADFDTIYNQVVEKLNDPSFQNLD